MYKNCNAGKHDPCSAEKTHVAYVFTIESFPIGCWILGTAVEPSFAFLLRRMRGSETHCWIIDLYCFVRN